MIKLDNVRSIIDSIPGTKIIDRGVEEAKGIPSKLVKVLDDNSSNLEKSPVVDVFEASKVNASNDDIPVLFAEVVKPQSAKTVNGDIPVEYVDDLDYGLSNRVKEFEERRREIENQIQLDNDLAAYVVLDDLLRREASGVSKLSEELTPSVVKAEPLDSFAEDVQISKIDDFIDAHLVEAEDDLGTQFFGVEDDLSPTMGNLDDGFFDIFG